MRNLFSSFLALSIIASFAFTAPEKTYKVDTDQSKVSWKGEKMTGKHTGSIELKDGKLMISNDKLTGGSFTINMVSLTDEDLEGEYKGKLEGHLKSDDFFGTENHPEAKFVMTNVKPKSGNTYEITGDLTIKNITKPVTFPATVQIKKDKVTADATIKIDRTKYDIRYNSGNFFDGLGDKMIYDEFELKVSLVANQQ